MYVSSPDYEIGDKLVTSILDFQVAANVIVIHLGTHLFFIEGRNILYQIG